MNKIKKCLFIVFALLFLVIVGELFFLLYNQKNLVKNFGTNKKTSEELSLIKAQQDHFGPRDIYGDDWVDLRPIELHNPVVSDDTLNRLKELYQEAKPDVLKSSWLVLEYEGTLEKINIEKNSSGQPIKLEISIRGFNQNIQRISRTGTVVAQLEIYEKTGSRFNPITIDQLKVGDKIVFRSTRDMMSEWNYSYLLDIIFKLN